MKTTVKTEDRGAVIVSPEDDGYIKLRLEKSIGLFVEVHLTQDQAGALIFGLEVAADVAQIKVDRQDPFCECAVLRASCPEHGG